MATRIGTSPSLAHAAFDAVCRDVDKAYRVLVSDLALTVLNEDLTFELVPLETGTAIWLEGTGFVKSVGAFSDCWLLRSDMNCGGDLRLFVLESVDVCVLANSREPIAPGWAELEYTEAPEIDDLTGPVVVQTCRFPPGLAVVPLDNAAVPMVRMVVDPAVVAPRNSLKKSAAVQGSAIRSSAEAADDRDSEVAVNENANPDVSVVVPAKINAEDMPLCERYEFLRPLGKGAFGAVLLAKDVDGRQVAIKRIREDTTQNMREADLLEKAKHPCVVSLVDAFWKYHDVEHDKESAWYMHIVMEFMPQTLHQRIAGKPLELNDFVAFSVQLLRALSHLDALNISHRDLKPENILLNEHHLKLADFGSAKTLNSKPSCSYICSRWWRAPELILGTTEYSTSVDWWSAGCVIGEMMLGKPVFRGDSSWGQMREIMKILGTPSPEEIWALSPSQIDSAKLATRLANLAKLQRCALPWSAVFPLYDEVPAALELVSQLLVYSPCHRRHPLELLCGQSIATLVSQCEPLPSDLLQLEEDEEQQLGQDQRRLLRQLGERLRSPALRHPIQPQTPTLVKSEATSQRDSSLVKMETLDVAHTRCIRSPSLDFSTAVGQLKRHLDSGKGGDVEDERQDVAKRRRWASAVAMIPTNVP
eukprot:TRINITY_DN29927_c0_g1_i3.p1 TRINITY_DN29927_c0_g1~~TRINITY_DN29927_c0_g1_i3.p1  ORF type:complete len:706 (-),score=125.67 TRINITY_DN29927_c0_g1_i3:163-2100(-)